LLYEFNKGNNATESARNIKAIWVSDNKRKPVSTVVPKIQSRKLQPRRGGTKSHHNCWGTSREAWIWSFNHSSIPPTFNSIEKTALFMRWPNIWKCNRKRNYCICQTCVRACVRVCARARARARVCVCVCARAHANLRK